MKLNFEIDITPQEVLELFDGNVEMLQRSIVELFMKQMAGATSDKNSPDKNVMEFWQTMSERSNDMFKQYQSAMTGKPTKKSD